MPDTARHAISGPRSMNPPSCLPPQLCLATSNCLFDNLAVKGRARVLCRASDWLRRTAGPHTGKLTATGDDSIQRLEGHTHTHKPAAWGGWGLGQAVLVPRSQMDGPCCGRLPLRRPLLRLALILCQTLRWNQHSHCPGILVSFNGTRTGLFVQVVSVSVSLALSLLLPVVEIQIRAQWFAFPFVFDPPA